MSDALDRREFLSAGWKVGVGLLAAAGVWTSWDLLKVRLGAGFAARVKTVAPDAVPANTVLEIPEARAYLTKIGDEVVALSEKCTHLGCRVPFCDSSGRFECPCHGTVFNRAGDHLAGPAPRGMDFYKVEVVDGVIEIDTGETIAGAPPGTETINEPALGPPCGEDHA
ncbi:MAG: Rieske 2Fe-2S domain-containing protein [Acidimicrobiia bacterium]|nr:Rieske 2Fe-2S domain-containing protein [Acidimicrobiia bacterium]NNL70632.1 Rieske 2Fe-2S domain-containing protein [Acidimicrobiia bacterium]